MPLLPVPLERVNPSTPCPTRAHPVHATKKRPSVTARRGVRRVPEHLRAVLAKKIDRKDAMRHLATPEGRQLAIDGCRVITSHDGVKLTTESLSGLSRRTILDLAGIRRLGSFHGARSTLSLHASRFALDGRIHTVHAESLLEKAWMMIADRDPNVLGYIGQGAVLAWPVGDGYITHFIDIVVQEKAGMTLVAVKPDVHIIDHADVLLRGLLPSTARAHGLGYALCGSLDEQTHVNLRTLGALRWKAPAAAETWWTIAPATTKVTLGRLSAHWGGGPVGRGRVLRALAQCHLDIDLSRPINSTTKAVWR